jgi:hypothetical protein
VTLHDVLVPSIRVEPFIDEQYADRSLENHWPDRPRDRSFHAYGQNFSTGPSRAGLASALAKCGCRQPPHRGGLFSVPINVSACGGAPSSQMPMAERTSKGPLRAHDAPPESSQMPNHQRTLRPPDTWSESPLAR